MLLPEFAPQSGVILTWPHAGTDWQDSLAEIENLYILIARTIVRYERLLVICCDLPHRQHVSRQLQQANVALQAVRFAVARTDDTWVRDYGPVVVSLDGRLVLQ